MKEIIQCVPNFSEGKNQEVIQKIVSCFQNKKDIKLLDYSNDIDHNRMVVSVLGTRESLKPVLLTAFKTAKKYINMEHHIGQHPRMGAVDVCPFVPIQNITLSECDIFAKEVAKMIYDHLDMAFFLYEKSATREHCKNLSHIRKGEYEGMFIKTQKPEWKPDFGNFKKDTGITAIGARIPLIAFNVLLNTNSLDIATQISKNVRHINGGLRFVKALPISIKERNITQVSMNLTNYIKTPLYRVFELIKIEAKRYGVSVLGSELIGLAPMDAIIQTAEYYLQIENLNYNQILEKNLLHHE